MICNCSTIICVNTFNICICCYLIFHIVMHTFLYMSIYMFLLVYEGPTADELRSVGLIDIYENVYFMNNLYVYMYIVICTLSK